MSEGIKITFFQKTAGSEKVIGNFGIKMVKLDMFFSDLKLIKSKEGKWFVTPPSRQYQCERTGENKFQNFWWFGKDSSEKFQNACIEALENFFKQRPDLDPRY